ncbi:uncharacterized protein DFL_003042 [Arthrobotrys flagrans]|uniref:Uncharacterized protein n=1 Tax=Arthrobotrys flagrans TaxID=97331 RepID=A0A437ACN3_ARTFL|nr:hypothetical protein DFL_003042 [Arthrobotrys flagrans]
MSSSTQYYTAPLVDYGPPNSSFFDASAHDGEKIDPNLDHQLQIDPDLENYRYTPSGNINNQLSVRFRQPNQHNTHMQEFYFRCGCCRKDGPTFTEEMITFRLEELRIKEDLLLCRECQTDRFPGLEEWRFRDIFKNSAAIPSNAMIRVLSPRSYHNGQQSSWQKEKIPPHLHRNRYSPDVCRRWLIPSLPFVWPLWSVKAEPIGGAEVPTSESTSGSTEELIDKTLHESLKELPEESFEAEAPADGNITKPKIIPYKCALCGRERDEKPSDFLDHIARYMGRFKSSLCTEEEKRENLPRRKKRLPLDLFARYGDALSHLRNTTTFAKYHGHVSSKDIEDCIELNSQDDILRRGLAEWRKRKQTSAGSREIILAEARPIHDKRRMERDGMPNHS